MSLGRLTILFKAGKRGISANEVRDCPEACSQQTWVIPSASWGKARRGAVAVGINVCNWARAIQPHLPLFVPPGRRSAPSAQAWPWVEAARYE